MIIVTSPYEHLKAHSSTRHHEFEDAEFIRRFAAYVIDLAISRGLGVFLGVPTFVIKNEESAGLMAELFVFSFYWILPLYGFGQILEKKLEYIYSKQSKGEPNLGFLQIIFRETFERFTCTIPLCYGYIIIYTRKDRRGWYDKMVGTRVIRS